MNLSLSSKIRLMDKRKFFNEKEYQPCWYATIEKGEKRRQYKWKIGVKFGPEVEEHSFGLTSFDIENDSVWNEITSYNFATKLIELFKSGGKKAVKEWFKDETIE